MAALEDSYDAEVLLEFYGYRAEHWIHLRTKVTKGRGSRPAGIPMADKPIDAAQARWRAVDAPHLVV